MQKRIIFAALLAFSVLSCSSAVQNAAGTQQEEEKELPADSAWFAAYSFIDPEADTIYDPAGSMTSFYNSLQQLDSLALAAPDSLLWREPLRVNILHFGDSHIQAGFLTSPLMHQLHRRFGNAGRGMIVPHRLGGSNEPRDYVIRAPGSRDWTSVRVIAARPEIPVGVSGLAVQSPRSRNTIQIATYLTEDSLDYSFNRIRIFHSRQAPIFDVHESISAGLGGTDSGYDHVTEIDLIRQTDSLELITYPDEIYTQGPLYGFSLENGRSGILYHALGINSACFLHWGRHTEAVRQTPALEPRLIIVSLGSNEASGANFNDQVFYNEVDRFMTQLRRTNPDASILLTAPVQAYRRGAPNPNFGRVSRVLRRYAQEKEIAFLDLYAVAGGEGAARQWHAKGLMGRDRIHFSIEGYRLQGLLIYQAIYNGYAAYARMAR